MHPAFWVGLMIENSRRTSSRYLDCEREKPGRTVEKGDLAIGGS